MTIPGADLAHLGGRGGRERGREEGGRGIEAGERGKRGREKEEERKEGEGKREGREGGRGEERRRKENDVIRESQLYSCCAITIYHTH